MEAIVLASNQDRGLSRVVTDLIGPRGKHLVVNGEVERNLGRGCWACARAPLAIESRPPSECEYVVRFMVVLLFEGISRLPSPRIKPLFAPRSKKLAVKPP
jgi:hypothetical protein